MLKREEALNLVLEHQNTKHQKAIDKFESLHNEELFNKYTKGLSNSTKSMIINAIIALCGSPYYQAILPHKFDFWSSEVINYMSRFI